MAKVKSKIAKDFDTKARMGLRQMADGGSVLKSQEEIAAEAGFPLALDPAKPAPIPRPTASGPLDMARSVVNNMLPAPISSVLAAAPQPAERKYADGGHVESLMDGIEHAFDFVSAKRRRDQAQTEDQPGRTLQRATDGERDASGNLNSEAVMRRIDKQQQEPVSLRHAIRHGMMGGGPVRGPGGPTDDKVPAMLSDGEYVIPSDVVEKIGVRNLDALIAANHKPVHASGYANGTPGGVQPGYEMVTKPNWVYGTGEVPPIDVTPNEPTIRNPNIGANGSAEARAYEASRTIAPGGGQTLPPEAPAPSPAARAAAVTRSVASEGLRTLGRAALPIAAGASALESGSTPTDKMARDMGVDTPNSFAGDLGVRAAGTLQDLGNTLFFGLPDRLGHLIGSGEFERSRRYTETPTLRAPAAPVFGEPGHEDGQLPVLSDQQAQEGIPAQFKSPYGDFDLRTREGQQLHSEARDDALREQSVRQGISAQRAQLHNEFLQRQYAPSPTTAPGESTTPSLRHDPTAFEPYGHATDPGSMTSFFNQRAGIRRQRDEAALASEERRNALTNATANRGHELQYGSSVYGHNLSARTAAQKARLDQFNADRIFSRESVKDAFERAKYFGTEGGDEGELGRINQDRAQKSSEAFNKGLESIFRTQDAKGNDVPDHASIASYRKSLDVTLPEVAKELESTGNAAAIKKAAAIRKRGFAALEPGDHADMMQLFRRRQRMEEARGLGPNQGTYKQSDNLLDYRQTGLEPRVFGGNRVLTKAGSVSANDLRYRKGPANSVLPDFNEIEDRDMTRGLRTR